MDTAYNFIETQKAIVPLIFLSFLVGICILLLTIDFITGVIASKKDNKIELLSGRIGETIAKFTGMFLLTLMEIFLIMFFEPNFLLLSMFFFPIFLVILQEYVSIGENFAAINGKKKYIFTIFDRIFEIIERKFFKKLQNSDI